MGLPQFLRNTDYKNPADPTYCPWHVGHRTELSPFQWLHANPEHMGYFLPWMAVQREGLPIFIDVMDFKKEFAQDTDVSTPVFVDVGGAIGHQCIAVRQRYPDLVGRVILQEQGFIIDQVKASPLPGFEGIEAETYDFFTPQPIKGTLFCPKFPHKTRSKVVMLLGARAYYFRNILHDWPDRKCIEILHNVKGSMSAESVILIDEMVLPECGAPWRATQLDMAMLTCLGLLWNAPRRSGGLSLTRQVSRF